VSLASIKVDAKPSENQKTWENVC